MIKCRSMQTLMEKYALRRTARDINQAQKKQPIFPVLIEPVNFLQKIYLMYTLK